MGTKLKQKLITNYKRVRTKMKMNQTEFLGRVGVTQSAGSRYESKINEIPRAIAVLAKLIYIDGQDIDARDYQ